VFLGTLIAAPSTAQPARAGNLLPPTSVEYRVQVLDQTTGQPVAGVTIEITERKWVYRCYGNNCSAPCEEVEGSAVRRVTSGPDGTGRYDFPLAWCAVAGDSPPTWIKEFHAGWNAPRVVDDPAAGIDAACQLASWATGSGSFTHVVRVTPEPVLAATFSPVLHRHGGYELQEDLADLMETAEAHAVLEAFNVLGQRVYGPAAMPPVHNWNDWHWDSFGSGQTPTWWRLNIEDAWRHRGASPGNRPLYYHVLPWGDGAVVQYWLWFNANDLTSQWGFVLHEGDWEYAAVRIRFDGTRWVPVAVNLSRHKGGISLAPAECWWSETDAPSYAGMRQGWSPAREHPHFWVASNSHALYNRDEGTYTLDLAGLGSCGGVYSDAVDYGLADHPEGSHSFFPYDRLAPMGEVWHTGEAHGRTWFDHLEGGPLEPLRFYGRFGQSGCDAPPGCADAFCGIVASFDGGTYQMAPRSPVIPEEPHKWGGFVDTPGPWGNANSRVSFEANPPRRCYLGLFHTTAGGEGDVIAFEVRAAHPELAGLARIRVLQGDVRFLDAGAGGEISLGPAVSGVYRVRQSRVMGTGRVRIDVFPQGLAGEPDGEELWADVAPVPDPASAGDSPALAGGIDRPLLAMPSPSAGRVRIRLTAALPTPGRVRVCDVAGREVWAATADAGTTELTWNGRTKDGGAVVSGVYLVYEEVPGRPVRVGRVVVVR
jgi:hypothetical protein